MGEKDSWQSKFKMATLTSPRFAFLCGCLFSFFLLSALIHFNSDYILRAYSVVPMTLFPEPEWRTPQTLAIKTVTSTPFARFQIHKVKTESGAIIDDWLWTDEREHVNILVHLKKENKFLLFRQKKYGLDRPYYATVGGLFNAGDTGLKCAQRELLEETGLEAESWASLGRYRVQVNRGGGILHAFMAKNCVPSAHKAQSFEADYEKQEKVLLTHDELVRIALTGEVGEAQWVATVALGLLHEDHTDLLTTSKLAGNISVA